KDKRLLHLYRIVPSRGNLLHHQSEGRKYFDSGDFALAQANRSSNISIVKTIRRDISDPLCLVPSSSNLGDNANQHSSPEKKACELKLTTHSHL
ncbi:hypothetical protein IWW34DRAFT_707236, partial [Fusarium oxysporum f. sp. albedinis]